MPVWRSLLAISKGIAHAMAHEQRAPNAALGEAGVKIPADRPLIEPVDRWLRGADAGQVVGESVAVRGEQ